MFIIQASFVPGEPTMKFRGLASIQQGINIVARDNLHCFKMFTNWEDWFHEFYFEKKINFEMFFYCLDLLCKLQSATLFISFIYFNIVLSKPEIAQNFIFQFVLLNNFKYNYAEVVLLLLKYNFCYSTHLWLMFK